MKQSVILILFVGLMAACTSEDKKIPDDVLPVDSMKLVVWDLIQAGSLASVLKEKDTTIKKLNTAYFAEVLKLHKISKENFFKSFDFYQAHPSLNGQLFDSINNYAQRRRGDIYKKME